MKPRLEIPEKHRVQLWQELGLDLGPDVHQILVRIGHTFRCRQSVLLDRHLTRQTDERIESKSRQKWEGVCVCGRTVEKDLHALVCMESQPGKRGLLTNKGTKANSCYLRRTATTWQEKTSHGSIC